VDFQFVLSIPIVEIEKLNKIAQLSSPFVEQMIVHFSSYTSRIAVDRCETPQKDEIISKLIEPYSYT
jgi:hypothetical protein